ncbi:tol-pal system protein, partial [Bradyrhizobium sp. NAS80.1]
MSSKFKAITGTVATAALLSLCSPVFAQSEDVDPEMRIERLESQLRQLTGQNEELQYRNRQLEERLRALEGGAQVVPGQAPVQPNVAAVPPAQIAPSQAAPAYRQQQQAVQPGYEQPQISSPAPIVQEQPAPGAPGVRRRGDAFDPNQNPNAPGVPRALGGGQQPMSAGAP